MSYLVLARKYRPHSFSEMVGQEHVVRALTNALVQQRLHHAYLFTGTRGVGKTTVSRILAKSLNCETGITAQPCGVCQACTEIDAGRFVDYTELDAASNRGVDEVQQLLEQAIYKPVQGRFKVFMIDEVHMLSNTAFNAMLKTLEEPPEYLKFVLATTDPQKVPVTVLSRCLQFNLRPIAPEIIEAHLLHVLELESIASEPAGVKLLAQAARGSMRDALSLTDLAIAYGAGKLQQATVRQMLGSVDRTQVFEILQALADRNGSGAIEICESLRASGQSAASALDDMARLLQRIAVLQISSNDKLRFDESDAESAKVQHLAQQFQADETQFLYSLCLQGRSELGLAPDEYVGLSMTLMRFLAFCSPPAEKKTLKPIEVVAQPAATPAATPAAEPAKQAAETSVDLADFWFERVTQLVKSEAISSLTRELALQSQLIKRNDQSWMLQIEQSSLDTPSTRERLQQALIDAGYRVSLLIEIGPVTDSPARRIASLRQQRQQDAEEIIRNDPYVQQLMNEYGAKIVPGSIQPL